MAKKTWIKVRRGILDPKHIDRLGSAWYLFLYILDQADWETGMIYDWKDKFAADDLGKPLSLIRLHRQRLEKNEYILCDKGQHSQTLSIMRWKDPRKDDFECSQTTDNDVLSDTESTLKDILTPPELSQSRARVEPELSQSFNDPSINPHSSSSHMSHTTDHMSHNISAEKTAPPELTREPCDDYGEPIKDKKKPKPKQDTKKLYLIATALAEVTGMSFDSNKEKIFREAKLIVRDPRVTVDEISRQFSPGADWYKFDWRGQKGQKPSLAQVRETIFTFDGMIPSRNGNKQINTGLDAVKAELARLEQENNG